MKKFSAIALSLALFTATSCATIVNGTHEPVSFSSEPEGAEIAINGEVKGQTPATISLERQYADQTVSFRKPGYVVQNQNLHSSISGWYFGNLLLGGIVGGVLDACDGSMWTYNDSLSTGLAPAATAQTQAQN